MKMKWIKTKQKRSDITVLPIIPGTLILSGAMLLAFLILLVILNLNGMVDLPRFVERILGTAENVQNDGDTFGEAFLDSLSGVSQNMDENPIFVEANSEKLAKMLRETKPAASYYQSCILTRTGVDGKETTRQLFRLVSNGREYTEILFLGQLERAVTMNETAIRITEQNQSRIFARTEDSLFTAEGEIGFPSLARMFSLLDAAQEGAFTLSLSAPENTSCIRAEFTDTLSGTREVYDILPDLGVIFAAQSYLPGSDTPYYSLKTTSLLTEISGFDTAIFDIPNSSET